LTSLTIRTPGLPVTSILITSPSVSRYAPRRITAGLQSSPDDTRNELPGGCAWTHDTVGGVVSATVTSCVACTGGSTPSLPVQVTVFGPTENRAGASLVTTTARPLQTSAEKAMPMR